MNVSKIIAATACTTAVFFMLFIAGCSKATEKTDRCNNKIADGNETEIDCGGQCTPCPAVAALNATLEGYSYNANTLYNSLNSQTGSVSITTDGTGGASLGFTYVGTSLNTPLPITAARAGLSSSDNYQFEISDTGSVVITSMDTLRNIISGHFSFRVTNLYQNNSYIHVQNGQFTNVRVHN